MNTIISLPIITVMLLPFCSGIGLSYNYFDEQAQSYCLAKTPSPSFVFAIRRDCAGRVAPTCHVICRKAREEILKSIRHQRKR